MYSLCLGTISKDFPVDNKKNWLYGYVYDVLFGYDSINEDDIFDIHKYLMKNYDIKECLDWLSVYLNDY